MNDERAPEDPDLRGSKSRRFAFVKRVGNGDETTEYGIPFIQRRARLGVVGIKGCPFLSTTGTAIQ